MIYDCFTFYNEWDILDMRVEELSPVVDKFVIVMGDQTFQGNRIPGSGDRVWQILERYEDISEKFIITTVNTWPQTRSAWVREEYQRNYIGKVLWSKGARDDDVIILSDADEIPRREIVARYSHGLFGPVQLQLGAYFYYLNVRANYEHTAKMFPYHYLKFNTVQEMRKQDTARVIDNAGWHFSYIGDSEFIRNKIISYAHSEFNKSSILRPGVIERAVENQEAFWDDTKFSLVEVDDTWPHAVRNDPKRWSRHIWTL